MSSNYNCVITIRENVRNLINYTFHDTTLTIANQNLHEIFCKQRMCENINDFNLILINRFFEGKHPDESPDDPSYLL